MKWEWDALPARCSARILFFSRTPGVKSDFGRQSKRKDGYRLNKVFLTFLVGLTLLLGQSAPLPAQPASSEFEGEWVGNLPDVGKIALELRPEYKGARQGRLFWLFEEMPVVWEPTGDGIALHRFVHFNQVDKSVALQLRLQADKSLVFENGGLVTPERLQVLQPCVFQKGPGISFDDVASFLRAGNQYEKFSIRGALKPLPESFPGPFMDLSILLFSDDDHVLGALLLHPKLSTEVLDDEGNRMLNAQPGSEFYGSSHYWLMPTLAAHPHVSKEMLAQLFQEKTNPAIWRAAALNPNAPKDYLNVYLQRIGEGEVRTRVLVARDRSAPREAWEAALAKGEPEVMAELGRNPNVPTELLATVAQHDPEAEKSMAGNVSAPPATLLRLSQSMDKQILWALQRNPSVQGEALQSVLKNLETNSSSSARGAAARDERTPPDLLEKLSGDKITFVRGQVAMNTNCPVDILVKLATDPYVLVVDRARENLTTRFPSEATRLSSTWRPDAQLNPDSSFGEEFQHSLEKGDVARVKELLQVTGEEDAIPVQGAIGGMLQTHFDLFADVLKQYVIAHGDDARGEIIDTYRSKPSQVAWMKANGFLEGKWLDLFIDRLMQRNQNDMLKAAFDAGLLSGASQIQKDMGLRFATTAKNDGAMELWIKAGAKP